MDQRINSEVSGKTDDEIENRSLGSVSADGFRPPTCALPSCNNPVPVLLRVDAEDAKDMFQV